ncbi:hypothetical protein BV898_14332 [Hypsibius exemplaris]|uniref:Uncharacterized protein n=1 Tax=Hypsibius exemplaris TaxID=2072580 RepID=A0A9X6N8Q0_HYPEX|nr:hypothetical protein BV898_14332 [Hypsibius exemplaris]
MSHCLFSLVLECDPSGTDVETEENPSDDTVSQTVCEDELHRSTGLDRDCNSISETQFLLDKAEDDFVSGLHYDEPVPPPEPSDDNIAAAVFESCLDVGDRNE